jgi:outer membrane protein TolC
MRHRHIRKRPLAAVLGGLALVSTIPAAAQTPLAVPAGALTLEQVLELAEVRSEAIAAARAGVLRAEGDQIRARSGLFPQVSASASYDRALASEFEGVFGGGASQCAPFTLDPSAALADRVAEIERAIDCGAVGNPFGGGASGDGQELDLPFGRANTWRANVTLSQNLYTGGRIGAQQALAAAGRSVAELGVATARAQLLFDVTQAFYDAALSERLVAIAEATLDQAQATVRQVEAAFRSGVQPEFELVRARVARDAQRPTIIRQRANREIALLRLRQFLDLPSDYELELAVSLEEATLPPAVFAARIADVEGRALQMDPIAVVRGSASQLPQRTPVQEAATVVQLREASLHAARAQRMPTVSFNSTYGRVGYPTGALPEFDRTNWTLGATVQVPILTGGRQRADEIVARAELEQSRAQLQQVQELAVVDTRTAWAELVAARAAWEATAGTVEQATRAHEIAQVRYREGVSTQLELSDARLLLQQAEAGRAQAARDLQVARARVALLPGLPFGATPARQPQTPQPSPLPSVPAPVVPMPGAPARNAGAQSAFVQTGGQ